MSLMLCHASHVSFHIQEIDVDISDGQQKKRKGRGITLKQNIYSRGGGPKTRIVLNGYGQPIVIIVQNLVISLEQW